MVGPVGVLQLDRADDPELGLVGLARDVNGEPGR